MNILVTGANGQLGTELRNAFRGSANHLIFTDVARLGDAETIYLDITNPDAVRLILESEKVDLVINCAAYVDVDRAEDDFAMADLLNRVAPGYLASVCKSLEATLIHISTDYVFGGEMSVPYREDCPPSPLGVYGATKAQGEKAIIDSGCKYIIFRTAWLYSPYGRNFVRTMRELTSGRPSLKVVCDQIGTPTYAADLAAAIVHVIASGQLSKTGIYNYTDEGVCSWYDLACAVRDLSGNVCDIRPCRTDEYPTKARRPAYSVLDKSKVKATFGLQIPSWYDSLVKCIARI